MSAIIIVDGLTPEVFSIALNHRSNPANLGRQEIARLFGVGRTSGAGPLPRFVSAAAARAREDSSAVKLMFICDLPNKSAAKSDCASELLIEPFVELSAGFPVVSVAPGEVPCRAILECAAPTTNGRPHERDVKSLRALIIGGHTELRTMSIAVALKNILLFDDVAVCAHLVGSATREAHFGALRHELPAAGIDVILDLAKAAEFVGLETDVFDDLNLTPCTIGPPEMVERLSAESLAIIERVCMHWTAAELRPLQGGFSGSLLFIGDGRQGDARTEPMVIKIDSVKQMRRELAGYYRVKDFMGKHIPSFGYPVVMGEMVGIGMDLAAMEGAPQTLQDDFEHAENDESTAAFLRRLAKTLGELSDRLYGNTIRTDWIAPFREFLLHTEDQQRWLSENAGFILEHAASDGIPSLGIDPDQLQTILHLIAANEDGIETEVCLAHGDLNFKNIISDAADNLWFIDWTHAEDNPVELDFAKLENDVKFVMSKEFEANDLPRLRQFEEYLLNSRLPAEAELLPASLKFVKWDLRYRKILNCVVQIRRACFDLKQDSNGWLIYQIALLKYALHTLSFDKRRERGECNVIQLLHALFSVETLVFQLIADDFHLRIRGERPSSYPARQRISIDQTPWSLDSPEYSPAYYVAPEVLNNELKEDGSGWAHSEDFASAAPQVVTGKSRHVDDTGRPLNPRGRTGLSGRGMLGRWGVNPAVAVVVTRRSTDGESMNLLVGRRENQLGLSLPRGFLFPLESAKDAFERILAEKVNIELSVAGAEMLIDDYYYDPRQTDHAWVEAQAYLVHPDVELATEATGTTDAFDEIDWWPLTADTINELSSSGARLVRAAITRLQDNGTIDPEYAARVLSRTG